MRLVRFFSALLMFLSAFLVGAKDGKPYGLLTDLMEHTDRTWMNGYASNVPVWDVGSAIESMQYVRIGSAFPSFSWIVPGSSNDTKQKGYRIILSSTYNNIMSGTGEVWDSGEVSSGRSTAVAYGGSSGLLPDKVYFWKIKTFTDKDGESEWSDIKAFRTAPALSRYAASAYPQVKTLESPVSVSEPSGGIVFVDFGKDAFAQLIVTLYSDRENDTVSIHLGESVKEGRVDRKPGGSIRYQLYRLALNRGRHTYRIKIRPDRLNTRSVAIPMPEYAGEVLPFRYCEIGEYYRPVAEGEIARETVHYPFNDDAVFSCSNDTLNMVWELCRYSIKATSFAGIYVDGDRERIPYEADALINQLCHYGTDREYSMARRSIEYLLKSPTWPVEWIMQAVIMAWHDFMYTGDSRMLEANYEVLKARTLMQLREKNGLISSTTGLQTAEFLSSIRSKEKIRDIVDWPHTGILGLNKDEGGEADGFVFTDYNAVTNAYHYESLKIMSKIANSLDRQAEASFYEMEAKEFLARFNKIFFKNKKGYYADGDTTSHSSLHANMFPVAFGMTPSGKLGGVVDFIHSRRMACSVYGSQFLMDAVYEASDSEYGLHLLTKTDDRSWYNMIKAGSTISMEAWDNKYKPNQDWNHAWGAAPANIIPRKLMGVEPLLPGFEKVRIKPQTASLSWAKAVVPTIRGKVEISIENNNGAYTMRLVIPPNMEGEVYLPMLSKRCEIKVNGSARKASAVKDAPFVYLGEIPSGIHTITMMY